MADKFELRNYEGETVWTGNERKEITKLSLPEGDYHLWKLAGTLPVRVIPARMRIAFQAATKKKKPRKRDGAATTADAGEPVSGEPIA